MSKAINPLLAAVMSCKAAKNIEYARAYCTIYKDGSCRVKFYAASSLSSATGLFQQLTKLGWSKIVVVGDFQTWPGAPRSILIKAFKADATTLVVADGKKAIKAVPVKKPTRSLPARAQEHSEFQRLTAARAAFNKENDKRRARLEVLRQEGNWLNPGKARVEFDRLYAAESACLNKHNLRWSPTYHNWVFAS